MVQIHHHEQADAEVVECMGLLAVGSNLGADRSGRMEHPESRNPQKGIEQLGLVHGLLLVVTMTE